MKNSINVFFENLNLKPMSLIIGIFCLGLLTFISIASGANPNTTEEILGSHVVRIENTSQRITTLKREFVINIEECKKNWSSLTSFNLTGKGCEIIDPKLEENGNELLFQALTTYGGKKKYTTNIESNIFSTKQGISIFEEVIDGLRVAVMAYKSGYGIYVVGDYVSSSEKYSFVAISERLGAALKNYSKLLGPSTKPQSITAFVFSVKE